MVPEHKPTWGPGTASAASVGHFLASAQHVLQHPPIPGLLGSNPSGSPHHSRHHFGLFHCLLCPTRQYTQLVGLCSAWASSCLSPLTTESGELLHDEVSHLLPRCRFPPEANVSSQGCTWQLSLFLAPSSHVECLSQFAFKTLLSFFFKLCLFQTVLSSLFLASYLLTSLNVLQFVYWSKHNSVTSMPTYKQEKKI